MDHLIEEEFRSALIGTPIDEPGVVYQYQVQSCRLWVDLTNHETLDALIESKPESVRKLYTGHQDELAIAPLATVAAARAKLDEINAHIGRTRTLPSIVDDVRGLFRVCGFEVRENSGFCELAGSIDAGGILVDAVLEHIKNLADYAALTRPAATSGDAPTDLYESIAGAIARGWCAPENANKVMDPDLAVAILREVKAELGRIARAAATTATKPAPLDIAEKVMELAHRWATATYCKALKEPYEDFDAIQREMRALLVTKPAAAPAVPIELMGVAEEIAEGSGFWRSCSGCHESNEGHPTGPHSAVFGCALGNGCSDCGGIGAVWDNNDYDAMAASWEDVEAAHVAQDLAPAEPVIPAPRVAELEAALKMANDRLAELTAAPIARQAQPTDRDAVRNAALEEAAAIVDAEHGKQHWSSWHLFKPMSEAIRALKGKSGSEGAADA